MLQRGVRKERPAHFACKATDERTKLILTTS